MNKLVGVKGINRVTAGIIVSVLVLTGTILIYKSHAAALVGDVNGDGKVDVADLSLMIAKWGTNYPPADFDHSGIVDVFDLSLLLANWGRTADAPTLTPTPTVPAATATSSVPSSGDLTDPYKKDIAMQLVSSAENSSLDWKAQYAYIEDIKDGRGYTAGIIGFCSGTGDMVQVVEYYTQQKPGNILAKYLPALHAKGNMDASHTGLDPTFVGDWKTAAADPAFQDAQNHLRDQIYFDPSVNQAIADGLHALGQFIYYDAIVMHGSGTEPVSFGGIRATAMGKAKTPAQGGDETAYLNAFLDARKAAMLTEVAHNDTSRVDTEQRKFLNEGNLNLNTPLSWSTYGQPYTIAK